MRHKEKQTIAGAIKAQIRRLRSEKLRERVVDSFFAYAELSTRLKTLSDRQIGQVLFDVLDDQVLVSPTMAISLEASERLFRSTAGGRTAARFNVPGHLPICPRCGEEMLHVIGIDEPDYRECVATECGYKLREHYESGDEEQNR